MDKKTAAVAFAMGLLGAFAYSRFGTPAQAGDAGRVVRASRIDLVDGSGRVRAQLGFSREGPPGLWLFDEKGTARLAMGLYADGTANFGLQDAKGRMIELMRSYAADEAPLLIFKNGGADKMILGLDPAGKPAPFLMSYEADGRRNVRFGEYHGP